MSALSNYPRLAPPISLPTKWNTWNLNNSSFNNGVIIGPDGFSISDSTSGTGLSSLGFATIGKSAGFWYWENTVTYTNANSCSLGISNSSMSLTAGNGFYLGQDGNGWGIESSNGGIDHNGSFTFGWGSTFTTSGTTIAFALDMKNGFVYCGTASGGTTTWMHSGDPTSGATGTGAMYGSLSGTIYPAWSIYSSTNATISSNFGQAPFVGSVPANYVAGMY